MGGWGISENASEKEKLKAEVNDYFHGLNANLNSYNDIVFVWDEKF